MLDNKWINMYLDIADRVAEESHAKKLKVGSIFVSAEGIISTGINGLPSGDSNICEYPRYRDEEEFIRKGVVCYPDDKTPESYCFKDEIGEYRLKTKDGVSHAEENLFAKIMRQGISTIDGYMFSTHSPCLRCAKVIALSGIIKVYYRKDYRSDKGIKWLLRRGVRVEKIENKKETGNA